MESQKTNRKPAPGEKGSPVKRETPDESGKPVRRIKLDENGNPVRRIKLDENGKPVRRIKLDENGNPVRRIKLDENGNPVRKVKLDENEDPVTKEKKAEEVSAAREEVPDASGTAGGGMKESDAAPAPGAEGTAPGTDRRRRLLRILIAADVALVIVLAVFLISRRTKDGGRTLGSNSDVVSVTEQSESGEGSAAVSAGTEGGGSAVDASSYTQTATILGAGDNLIHSPIYEQAEQSDGSYDFAPCYAGVSSFINAADVATINQETPIATSVAEPSGYPRFNTPPSVVDALWDAGFDVFNIGNNHFADQGGEGVSASLNYYEEQGYPYVGVYWDAEDRDNIRIVEKNGIRIAFLGFFSFVNQPIPEDPSFQFVMLDEPDRVQAQIELAKSEADIVVVHAHWGNEYETALTPEETEMAQNMVNWGADIIFGNHPHVLQELDVLTRESDGEKCPVIYSLGNFLSAQDQKACLVSGLLTVTVGKNEDSGDARALSMEFEPVVTHYTGAGGDAEVLLRSAYTDEEAAAHGINDKDPGFSLSYIDDTVKQSIPEEYIGNTAALS